MNKLEKALISPDDLFKIFLQPVLHHVAEAKSALTLFFRDFGLKWSFEGLEA